MGKSVKKKKSSDGGAKGGGGRVLGKAKDARCVGVGRRSPRGLPPARSGLLSRWGGIRLGYILSTI